jgi:acetyltransferase-like isoleucine patch superfamily enzyme
MSGLKAMNKILFRISIKKLLIRIFNIIFILIFSFKLRNLYLNIFGNKISKDASLHSGIYFFDFNNLTIGDRTTINNGCYIDNRYQIIIGNNVNISHDCKLYTNGHNINLNGAPLTKKPILIEDDVWIFPNVVIMPGVKIHRGAVIYPCAVIINDVGEYEIYGGNPAVCVGMRNKSASWMLNNKVHFSK